MGPLKRLPVPRCAEGLEDHWSVVPVRLRSPLFVDDPEEPCRAVGYYRSFGLRAVAEQIPSLLEQFVGDGRPASAC